jgi:hypothetical protein
MTYLERKELQVATQHKHSWNGWNVLITRKDEPETTAKTPQKSTPKKMELRRETEEKRRDWQVYKVPHLPGAIIL